MTEQEKKAYDILLMLEYFTQEKEDKQAIVTILELVDKQQKEIEELKNTETYKIAIIDKYKYVSKDKIKAKIKEYKKQIEELKELEKMEQNIEEVDVSRIMFAQLILENLLEE